jgi:hypothetical protein
VNTNGKVPLTNGGQGPGQVKISVRYSPLGEGSWGGGNARWIKERNSKRKSIRRERQRKDEEKRETRVVREGEERLPPD